MDRRGHAVFLKTEVAPQHFPRACLSQIFPISVSEIMSHNFFPQHLNEKYLGLIHYYLLFYGSLKTTHLFFLILLVIF